MSDSGLEGWVCLECGRTNYYRVSDCRHCGKDRVLSNGAGRPAGGSFSALDDTSGMDSEAGRSSIPASASDKRKRIVFLSLATFSFFTWFSLVTEFRKWDARWGGLNVLVIALLAAIIIGWWIARRSWFNDRTMSTRWRFMIIPAIAFVVCAGAGIFFTEPSGARASGSRAAQNGTSYQANRRSGDYQYNYGQSRAGQFYLFAKLLDLGGGVADADVDEGCLIVLLVILVVVLVVGSFFVPHFWVLATFILTVTMAMFTFREWRIATLVDDR